MNEVQLRIAESCDGLLMEVRKELTANEVKRQLTPGRIHDSCIRDLKRRYRRSELVSAMTSLGDAINTSIHTGVHMGVVRVRANDSTMDVAGKEVTLPIAADVAHSLYTALDPSLVGVENRGNALDTALRKSHEASQDLLRVSGQLASFDFPEEMRRVHELLCPSAVSLHVQLYKLVIYGKGDFFVPHRDSMSSADMLGSISLQIPVMQRQPAEGEIEEQPEGGEDGADGGGEESDYSSSRHHSEDESGTSQSQKSLGHSRFPPNSHSSNVKRPERLVFYVGRHSSDVSVSLHKTELSGWTPEYYRADGLFSHVLDLAALDANVEEDGTLTMSYAAWSDDVLHEVRRLESGYRAVLVYRLYRQGHKLSYIPASVRTTVADGIAHVMQVMRSGENAEFRYLGVTLRHTYPPAGLRPEYLKGIDAVMYIIASKVFRCLLFNAHEVRPETYFAHHTRRKDDVTRAVFFTAGAVPEDVDLSGEDAVNAMARQYKVFANTAWMELGFGTLVGGGYCFGNADCGTDWWYRSAVLIITPEPSLWMQRRNLVLVALRGPGCMRRLLSNLDVAGRIASFI